MNRRNAAFTLVELMIAMAIVMLVLYAAINFFIVSVRQYKVQTKITETNVEGILGLELLPPGPGEPRVRSAVEQPGHLHGEDRQRFGSQRSRNAQCPERGAQHQRARRVYRQRLRLSRHQVGARRHERRGGEMDDADPGRRSRGRGAPRRRTSIHDAITSSCWRSGARMPIAGPSSHRGGRSYAVQQHGRIRSGRTVLGEYRLRDRQLRVPVRPFNRAEYYIDNTSRTVPQRCAPNTGVLVKAVVAHDGPGPRRRCSRCSTASPTCRWSTASTRT